MRGLEAIDRIRTFLVQRRYGALTPRNFSHKDELWAFWLGALAADVAVCMVLVLADVPGESVAMTFGSMIIIVGPAVVPYFIVRFLVLLSPWVKESRVRTLVILFLVALFSVWGIVLYPLSLAMCDPPTPFTLPVLLSC